MTAYTSAERFETCAGCSRPLENDLTCTDESRITSGICGDCRHVDPADPRALGAFIDRIHAPVVMLDGDGVVVDSNERAADFLGTSRERMHRARGGDVMECAWARLPGGCGKTEHCGSCTLRNSIVTTFSTGQSLRRVSCDLAIGEGSPPRTRNIVVSTERIANVVLLRLEGVWDDTRVNDRPQSVDTRFASDRGPASGSPTSER